MPTAHPKPLIERLTQRQRRRRADKLAKRHMDRMLAQVAAASEVLPEVPHDLDRPDPARPLRLSLWARVARWLRERILR